MVVIGQTNPGCCHRVHPDDLQDLLRPSRRRSGARRHGASVLPARHVGSMIFEIELRHHADMTGCEDAGRYRAGASSSNRERRRTTRINQVDPLKRDGRNV